MQIVVSWVVNISYKTDEERREKTRLEKRYFCGFVGFTHRIIKSLSNYQGPIKSKMEILNSRI
jgi:hypothetical protein